MIVSADTLVYFGPLEDGRRGGGRRAAGRADGSSSPSRSWPTPRRSGYALSPHGRYSHARDYVERVLAAAGLDARDRAAPSCGSKPATPVAGLVVKATK